MSINCQNKNYDRVCFADAIWRPKYFDKQNHKVDFQTVEIGVRHISRHLLLAKEHSVN